MRSELSPGAFLMVGFTKNCIKKRLIHHNMVNIERNEVAE